MDIAVPQSKKLDALGADEVLRAKARAFVEGGQIVRPLPRRRWGGPGAGASCALCGSSVEPHETDIEIEDPRGGPGRETIQHFHVPCLSAIEDTLRELEPAPPVTSPPPTGVTPERQGGK